MAVPVRTASPDALATPWAGSRIHPPAPAPVTFSDLAATRSGGSATGAQSLETPWQDATVRPAMAAPVTFSSLPAPVATPRPAPLTVRSAFVPRPRPSTGSAV